MRALCWLLPSLLIAAAPAQQKPTFCEDVAPIVFSRCANCHRPGEVAPFPLLSYQECRKRGKTIRAVVEERFMPPWHPDEGHGDFANTMRLSAAEIATIGAWVDGGMPEGDKSKLPPLPDFPGGWQLGEPDLVVQMPAAFEVPAKGRDIYRNFVLPLDLPDDVYLTAIEVRPQAREVLHHVLFFLDDSGEARSKDGQDGRPGFSGMGLQRLQSIGGWAVGGMPEKLPAGLALPLPKGHDLVLQSHFHPSGRRQSEQTTLGLHFTKDKPRRTLVPIQLPPFFGAFAGLDIPAGEAAYRLADSFELPCAVDAFTVGGHAHMLCRSLQLQASQKGKDPTPLLRISAWDFDWQNRYTYREPVRLEKGAALEAELLYDNSKANPNNPNKPPKRVRWGRESTDEMGSVTLMVAPADEADLDILQQAVRKHSGKSAVARFQTQIDRQFDSYDKNGDGKISRDEAPRRLRQFFATADADGDGLLDKDELKKALEGMGGLFGGGARGGG